MYSAEKRHERYVKNAERECLQALKRYNDNSESINDIRRQKYHENLEINRKKLKLRQQKRRAKLKNNLVSQNDTNSKNTPLKAGQDDTKQ